jgi:hypothetical protein
LSLLVTVARELMFDTRVQLDDSRDTQNYLFLQELAQNEK